MWYEGNGWMAELVDAMDSKSIALKGHEGSNPSPPTIFNIKNIRVGFATNSSSTHSVVLVGKNNLYTQNEGDPSFKLKNFLYRVYGTFDTVFEKNEKKQDDRTGFRFRLPEDSHCYNGVVKFLWITGSFYKSIKYITGSDQVALDFLCQLYRGIYNKNIYEDLRTEFSHVVEEVLDISTKTINGETTEILSGEDITYLRDISKKLLGIKKHVNSWLTESPNIFEKINSDMESEGIKYELPIPDLNGDEETEDFKRFARDLIGFISSSNVMLYSYEYDESCPNNVNYLREMNFKFDKPEEIQDLIQLLDDSAYYNNQTDRFTKKAPVVLNKGEKFYRFKREVTGTGEVDYVFFNKINGSKIRFSLDTEKWNNYCKELGSSSDATHVLREEEEEDRDRSKKNKRIHQIKALYPELVDLKITDYCVFGCEFCYQSSTRNGVHAPIERLKKYIDVISDLKVFEIALGGGEPTTHPEFPEILEWIRGKGMVVNFTTYSAKWLNDPVVLRAVAEHVSGIGVSVHTGKDTEKVKKITEKVTREKEKYGLDHYETKIIAQHVFGSTSADEFNKILKSCMENNIHILLLGPKRTGFGKDYKFIEPGNLLFFLKLHFNPENIRNGSPGDTTVFLDTSLSVDTEFASRFEEFLRDDLCVQPEMYTTGEGLHSFYIDGVENKMGRSSYVNHDEFTKIPVSGDRDEVKAFIYKNYLKY